MTKILLGHEIHYWRTPMSYLYQYDPTDDGPEVEVITRILANHPAYIPGFERQRMEIGEAMKADLRGHA